MKKKEVVTGQVKETIFPNVGKIETEDTVVRVKEVIEGQKVSIQLQKKRNGYWQGRKLEVLEKSVLETLEPICPHFGECGGCTYQTLPPDTLLQMKEKHVEKLLSSVSLDLLDCKEDGLYPRNYYYYRNKMELSFGDAYKGGPLSLGMHKKSSHYDIIPIEECYLMSADMTLIAKQTRLYFEKYYPDKIQFYNTNRHEGYLRHLLIRQSYHTKEILVDLITTTKGPKEEEVLIQGWVETLRLLESEGKLEGKFRGILQTYNDALADVVKDEGTVYHYGNGIIQEELLGLKFEITPFSFFQPNTKGAELIYQKIREYIGETKDKVIFDLYCGTGTIAQILAPVAKKVVGVEIVPEAIEAAKRNATLNGLDNCEFIAQDVLKVIDELKERKETPDLMVLDPPRDGIHPKAIERLISFEVPRIVYVSCKPTSLARDLEYFLSHGYRVEKWCVVDQFWGTVHVETVCLMSRKEK